MSRSTNPQFQTLLPACETQSALVLMLNDATVKRWIQENAGETTIASQPFIPHLVINEELRQTIENPVDRVSVSIQNVDRNLGINIIQNLRNYKFADGLIQRMYRDIRDPSISQTKTIFHGLVTEVGVDEKIATFSFSPDYIAFGNCVAAETISGAEWKFPGLPTPTEPGGGGDDGGGVIFTCPSVDDFVWVGKNTQMQARLVKIGDKLWNPINQTYSTVTKAEIILNQRIIRIETANKCVSRSSETHKLIIDFNDNVGTKVCNLQEKDLVLTYSNFQLEMSSIVSIREDGFEDVVWIELETGNRIYCSGSDYKKGIVAHNAKDEIGGGILI
jgi:hypothetical protein